jgi:hypothetical protein
MGAGVMKVGRDLMSLVQNRCAMRRTKNPRSQSGCKRNAQKPRCYLMARKVGPEPMHSAIRARHAENVS